MKHAFEKAMRQLGREMGEIDELEFYQIDNQFFDEPILFFRDMPKGVDLTDPQADE